MDDTPPDVSDAFAYDGPRVFDYDDSSIPSADLENFTAQARVAPAVLLHVDDRQTVMTGDGDRGRLTVQYLGNWNRIASAEKWIKPPRTSFLVHKIDTPNGSGNGGGETELKCWSEGQLIEHGPALCVDPRPARPPATPTDGEGDEEAPESDLYIFMDLGELPTDEKWWSGLGERLGNASWGLIATIILLSFLPALAWLLSFPIDDPAFKLVYYTGMTLFVTLLVVPGFLAGCLALACAAVIILGVALALALGILFIVPPIPWIIIWAMPASSVRYVHRSQDPKNNRMDSSPEETNMSTGDKPATTQHTPCPICSNEDREGKLELTVPGRYECETCKSTIETPTWDEIPALLKDIERGARAGPVLFSPNAFHLNPQHKDLFRDAWAAISWGRDNAGLILLGALIESVLREVIEVHRNASIRGGLHDLILYCRDERLLPSAYLDYADTFKREVRNLWQHQLTERITRGGSVAGHRITWDKDAAPEEIFEKIKTAAESPPPLVNFPVEDNRWAMYPRQRQIEAALAPHLYDQTWWWLLWLTTRALRSQDYDAWKARIKEEPIRFLKKKIRKGGVREWKEFTPKPQAPFEYRHPPMFTRNLLD